MTILLGTSEKIAAVDSFIEPYKAIALQLETRAVNELGATEARALMMESISRVGRQIRASKAFVGPDCRLVVLPEYFLTGFPMGETSEQWREKACLASDGPEYKALADIARANGIFLSGNAYETDVHFPELYFQASFVIDPQGEMVLRYRRLNSMYTPTPHDVLKKYVSAYGQESLFPVARTAIGNLACIASEEIVYPEIARCLAFNGAEVFLHSSSEVGSPMQTQKNIAKLARAFENMAYVVSANSAGITGYAIPANSTDGHSQVVHYEGLKLCEAGYGESMAANASIDIEALRRHRRRPGMTHFLSRQRFELFAQTYAGSVYPADNLEGGLSGRKHFTDLQQRVIEELRARGVIQ
jgi:predicted amidohydrolase